VDGTKEVDTLAVKPALGKQAPTAKIVGGGSLMSSTAKVEFFREA